MEKENSLMLDKLILYTLAIICPILALTVAIILGYAKNNDYIIDRIKLISLYEIFDFLVIGISFIIWGKEGLIISIIILFVFYILLCGLAAHNKNDYISRGIALGLFANHYSLAIMQTSKESTSRVDNSKWPDSGLAAMLMFFKLIFIFIIYILINNININNYLEKQIQAVLELQPKTTEDNAETITELPLIETSVIHSLSYNDIYFVADTNLFISEENQHTNIYPDIAEDLKLQIIANDINNILNYKPDQIFLIYGYTADIGNKEDLVTLSMQRADKVRDILVSFDVPIENMMCIYIGGTSNWGNNLTEETRKRNRVVRIEIEQ